MRASTSDETPGCVVCGSRTCTAHPDLPVHDNYPFLPTEPEAKAEPVKKAKRKRRLSQDRAHHGPTEDR